ncbi:isoprenylcysteine carboxyl methyltransferase [Devosia sp. Root413D1]|uniref:methyltransferase family protein n=1 Tax=unclassified Devosia TaxID=196773 RepID=UPI0006FAAD74|nr:isoprenylcysteine carboxylmethyltransferase family protein [Devosia sp. Root413D1]KQW85653.1 isoprenylcysteine carboxyl methyltransferase [Devosia sp. Root413D1]
MPGNSRIAPITGSVIFLFVAPGVVAGLIPYWISGWQVGPALAGIEPLRWLGGSLLLLGAVLLVETFARFALQGRGTPAPVYPTETLVVTGSYRFVRNPMYVAVVSLILGQGLLFGNLAVLAYGAAIWLIVHLFVISYEEPTLARSFGARYERYKANVRRWIPRLTPWTPKE